MHIESAKTLKSLPTIRERCEEVFKLGIEGKLLHFDINLSEMKNVSDFILQLIKRDYKNVNDILPHGRWRHFSANNVDRMGNLLSQIKSHTQIQQACIVLDLVIVAVLLDAGAGPHWIFKDMNGNISNRSEGLAVATFEMFTAGLFSSDSGNKLQVDSVALEDLSFETFKTYMQHSDKNELVGIEGRFSLLKRLGVSITDRKKFGSRDGISRPSGFLFILIPNLHDGMNNIVVETEELWDIVINSFRSIWPEGRTVVAGEDVGDVWFCESTQKYVPFHKLSQWLQYSIMEPMSNILGVNFRNSDLMTGLAEYRNGGLFVDFGVLKPKNTKGEKCFLPNHQLIVEWRALTVCLLDRIAESIRKTLDMSGKSLTLPMVLEAGTWKAGREISAKLRPDSSSPPFNILSDGTLF